VLYISETTPGVPDERVLKQATAERHALLINDKDFPMLVFLQRMTSTSIVLMRMPRARSRAKGEQLLDMVARYGTRLRGGHDRDSAARNPPPAASTCATAAGGEVTLPRRSPTVKEGAAPAS